MATLAELTAAAPRLALVGLAKNTGKTVALAALLAELAAARRTVGVTSVGRDGEEHDVIDFRIAKPPVELDAGALVATTDGLLRASGVPHELLERTGIRTPLGEVLVARLKGAGKIEVAGPSAAADARRVADTMLSHGAEQVLIDGAIDRRAASSPEIADALVMSTGAILSEEIEEVVTRTADAVALVRLAGLDARHPGRAPRQRARRRGSERELRPRRGPPEESAAAALRAHRRSAAARRASARGADRAMAGDRRRRPRGAAREADRCGAPRPHAAEGARARPHDASSSPSHGPEFYARAGIELLVSEPIDLRALTVNPVAPQSHEFDSARLRALLGEKVAGVPIFDVLHPSYSGAPPMMARRGAASRS